jgi:Ras-related protein Rab-8A
MGILLVYDVTDERSFNSERSSPMCWRDGGIQAERRKIPFNKDIRTWYNNIEQHASEGVNKILIGNKCDWTEKKVGAMIRAGCGHFLKSPPQQIITEQQGQELAEELKIKYLETSAKTNINVEEAFFTLAR